MRRSPHEIPDRTQYWQVPEWHGGVESGEAATRNINPPHFRTKALEQDQRYVKRLQEEFNSSGHSNLD